MHEEIDALSGLTNACSVIALTNYRNYGYLFRLRTNGRLFYSEQECTSCISSDSGVATGRQRSFITKQNEK